MATQASIAAAKFGAGLPQLVSYGSYGAGGGSGGGSAYGSIPQPIATPNPYADLSAVYPDLPQTNQQVSQNILGQLRGELSPETIDAIHNAAATFGVTSGMPGSQLAAHAGLKNLGLAVENIQNQGLQNYLNSIQGISSTQTVRPETQADIATQNAIWKAAPDPRLAAEEQQRLFQQQLDALTKFATSSPAAGTLDPSSRTGGVSPTTVSAPPAQTASYGYISRPTNYYNY
jgi:hypothetical protein